ncbi:MAG: transglutaminase-like domain-containing protein [Clostridia bacterium]
MLLVSISYMLISLLISFAAQGGIYQKSGTTVDASTASDGYLRIMQEPTSEKLKLRISCGKYTLTYDLNSNGEYEAFPLQLGNGKYKIQVLAQVSGRKYRPVSSISFKVSLSDAANPYRHPNQYVNYNAETLAVKEAQTLCNGLATDDDKFKAIYQYIVSNYQYDYDLANAVHSKEIASGYVPVLDGVFESRKGICFDLAALTACMLRSQGIPAQLVIGYADRTYHAWNEVLLQGQWVRCDPTSDICQINVSTYSTESMY